MVWLYLKFIKWQTGFVLAAKRGTLNFWAKINELVAILNSYLDQRDGKVDPEQEPELDPEKEQDKPGFLERLRNRRKHK